MKNQTLHQTYLKTSIVDLNHENKTTVYVCRYLKEFLNPKLVVFNEPVQLLNYCLENNISEAINGGFFDRKANQSLGELWIDSRPQEYTKFAFPWSTTRSCIYIDNLGNLSIAKRFHLPKDIAGSMLQTGPALLHNGFVTIDEKIDFEGYSTTSSEFDSDITVGRYPRAALAYNDEFIWTIVCDGRSAKDSGMSLIELANFIKGLGASEAINLDGGASSTLVSQGRLCNKPRGLTEDFPDGREIYSAIIFG